MDIVTKETFKAKVQKLVEHFSDNEEYYKSTQYKEDHLRQEFINPFFKALGWDMDNEQGFAPQYREVIHEDRIEIEGKPKAPDYAFKVGSDRKFFVEAKASSVRVFSEIDPAFQLRRYAWSGQLPVSILTDFEEFSIYDTTIEPKHTDKSFVARVKYINYKDYLKEADYLWDTFSKEAVWKGSFDKFAKREKKGSQLVDKSFLKEIELWRDLVAKDVASNNNLNIYELNSVVQKFIDRIIFLRIAEDRGVESYETLRSAVKSPDTYSQLLKIFSRADEKYNSSLFDLKKDELSTKIKISDKTLDRILNNLYYPKSPYEFSVIGVDILGSVYEQFLGKVIRLTKGGNAVIEEKPEVKKAGGVYYTPQYIVDYIVKNTVGELVKDKTPKDVAKLKIVDPACGSGSFLIGAYNYLLNWHHKYYVENDVEKNLKAKKLFKDGEGNYFLSTQEKKDILLNNIHGVDIDPQAVEVTKLSLALKMLEGENSETINAQYKLFADRILPDLSSNIKCGNSLIGSDYYSDKQITLLGDEELRKVNAFDWDKEFPLVFRYGGFDAVIGNPPYFTLDSISEEEKKYLEKLWETFSRQGNIYYLFINLAHKILKDNGVMSFINERYYLDSSNAKHLRNFVKKNFGIKQIVDFQNILIFDNANTLTIINSFQKSFINEFSVLQANRFVRRINDGNDIANFNKFRMRKDQLEDDRMNFVNPKIRAIGGKMLLDSKPLENLCMMGQGIKSGANDIFIVDKKKAEELHLEKELLQKYIKTRDIKPFSLSYRNLYLILLTNDIDIKNYPNTLKYLAPHEKKLKSRYQFIHGQCKWYALSIPQSLSIYKNNKPKIITPLYATENKFVLDSNNEYYSLTDTYVIQPISSLNENYLLGILNSKLLNFYSKNFGKIKEGYKNEFSRNTLKSIPIKIPNNNLMEQVSNLTKEIQEGNEFKNLEENENRSHLYKGALQQLKDKLDQYVYDIYGITGEEIKFIENSFLK